MIELKFQTFLRVCYPNGVHPAQEADLRRAFFSGAMVLMTVTGDAAKLENQKAMEMLDQVAVELISYGENQVAMSGRRN